MYWGLYDASSDGGVICLFGPQIMISTQQAVNSSICSRLEIRIYLLYTLVVMRSFGVDTQVANIKVLLGILIGNGRPTWLYATASEHAVLYQYQVFEALDIFLCMISGNRPQLKAFYGMTNGGDAE